VHFLLSRYALDDVTVVGVTIPKRMSTTSWAVHPIGVLPISTI
jgi:hypothetical protein